MAKTRNPPKRFKLNDEAPSFMREHAGRALEGLGIEDVMWPGEDGNLAYPEISRMISEAYSPKSALRAILTAIIDANPVEKGPTPQDRLETAMKALVPSTNQVARGRKRVRVDDKILEDFALEYLQRAFGFIDDNKTDTDLLTEIAHKYIGSFDPSDISCQEHIKRLQSKFRESKDKILVSASAVHSLEGQEFFHYLQNVQASMGYLGILPAPTRQEL